MNQIVTHGIILARTDYGEADRIITMLTPDHGKLRLMAKGVRRLKSKLAGGIELFSTSELTYMPGRGEIGRLISTRLQRHYAHIVEDVNRTMLGYDLIKQLNKATEDQCEPDYYELLEQAFDALDDVGIDIELIRLWFSAQLLRLGGHTPNLQTEADGSKLQADGEYEFSFDDSAFFSRPGATFHADDIKFLRLVFAGNAPGILQKVSGIDRHVGRSGRLVAMLQQQNRG
ncbi:DNA repair protein RecO [Candidatus Saccharibacteria bacterium]|nr:MAG: DNA repair protein RecO [Candidatus Saccharibacteria bacterium]